MYEFEVIEIANRLAGSVSGWNRYVRVNDHVVDTMSRTVVAMVWPRAEHGAFPVRKRGDSVVECLT